MPEIVTRSTGRLNVSALTRELGWNRDTVEAALHDGRLPRDPDALREVIERLKRGTNDGE
jgi:hypothetical protein